MTQMLYTALLVVDQFLCELNYDDGHDIFIVY